MTDYITKISRITDWFYKTKNPDHVTLLEAYRELTAVLVLLENQRAEYHKQWQAIIFHETGEGKSVARAENQAHFQVPELYKLRRIMDGGYKLSEAMRTIISFIKHEMTMNLQQ